MVSSSAVLLLFAVGRAQEAALCDSTGAAPCDTGYEHHVQLLQKKVKVALKADGDIEAEISTKTRQLRPDGQALPWKPKLNKNRLVPLQDYKPLPKRLQKDKHGLAFISRGKGGPEELLKGGNHMSEETEHAIDHLLELAEGVEEAEHKGTRKDGEEGEFKSETQETLQEIEAAMEAGGPEDQGDQVAAILNQHHDELVHAINEVAESMDVEDALAAGALLTTEDLEEASQEPDSPERTSAALANMTVQADMVAQDSNQLDLLQQAVNGSARFLINFPKWEMPIRYCYDPNIAPSSRVAFDVAVQHFMNRVPCLQFEEIAATYSQSCSQQPAIYVQSSDSGCYANVGKMAVSVCNLQPQGCDTMGIAAHELGHNLGMLHEQSRADVGEHIQILWDNIQPNYRDQYYEESAADVNLEYDIMSLMHYGDTSFALTDSSGNQLKTMVQKQDTGKVMGNRMGLTNLDAKQVAAAYCGADYTHEDFKLCTNDPDSCTSEECICHQDPTSEEPILKVGEPGCYKCLSRCPTSPYGTSAPCGCPVGCSTESFQSGGTTYTMCNEGCQDGHDHPTGAPAPAPEPIPPVDATAGTSTSDDPNARRDVEGCLCRKSWSMCPALPSCETYCCNPDSDPGGEWCFKEDETCGSGANWGYCGDAPIDSSTDGSTIDSSTDGSTIDSSTDGSTIDSSTDGSTAEITDESTDGVSTNTDECMWAKDDMCDEPVYCMEGTDCTDCGNCDGGEPHPFGYVEGDSSGASGSNSNYSWPSSSNWSSWPSSSNWSSWPSSSNWSSWPSSSNWSSWPSSSNWSSSNVAGAEPCSDYYLECAWYTEWCNSGSHIDGYTFFEACKRSCGWCEAGTNPSCYDYAGSVTCEMYADPYCDPQSHGFIDGLPFQTACEATCGVC